MKELQREIGEEDFAEVAAMFLDEMAEALAGLCNATGHAGSDAFHGLRGSALNLGFADFAAACAEAEKLASEGQAVDTDHLNWLYRESVKAFGTDLPAAAA
ncbi:Hpt domain-containing protein [Nioella aestuarii]|uniref:Hpt domain-containing protein n=1 Tax=Nioella aestuarii TaxID=1662864 RepID=UPI003D7F56AA